MIHVLRSIFFSIFLIGTSGIASDESNEISYTEAGPIFILRSHDQKVSNLLANEGDTLQTAIRDSLKRKINSVFDFNELSKIALGTHWGEITKKEREKFVTIFGGIIQEQNFDTFLTYYRDGKLNYEKENINGKFATVNASVPLKRGSVSIEYLMHIVNEKWRIYDVKIDSVSTAEGNRKRYERYIKKHSYEKLILQLEKQLDRLMKARD